jgi:hypothetical protein
MGNRRRELDSSQLFADGGTRHELPAHIRARYRDEDEPVAGEAVLARSSTIGPTVAAPNGDGKELELQYKRSTGSYTNHYVKEDGTKMTKWGLHVPVAFVERFKWFMGHLNLNETASEFVVRAVIEKMRREISRRKAAGTWKSFEEMSDVG